MTTQKLAFLENFYTDVTLYIPAEPAVAGAAVAPAPVAAAEPAPAARPAAAPPVRPAEPATPAAVNAASRVSSQPSTAFSKPSAGLERLVAKELVPAAPEPLPAAAAPIAAPTAAPGVPPVMLTPFSVLGSNMNGVVLLFRVPHDQFPRLHRNVFLNKMLQALGYVMEDVVLVNVEADLPVALTNLRRELAAANIIAFGKNLLDVTIRNTQIYEPVQFPGLGLSYLASATVDLVEYDVSLKKRLWPGLQRMFGKA
ncbi:hypothetical protein [Hymenobacter antarcticus]|uniref:Uncharacterized protein n=1 Tax=Hymenobacter antarcticus TaxID=486270 RepID=A0ABP7P9K9_9BACT